MTKLRSSIREQPGSAPLIGESIKQGHLLPLAAAGSTYSQEEISTFLQYELAYLKEAYRQATERLDALKQPELFDGLDEESAHRVEEYLNSAGPIEPGQASHLVVVEMYPREGQEYGNGFVHRRVKLYQEAGAKVHVAVVSPRAEREIFEYDGVRVIAGQGHELAALLKQTRYTSISTHFMTEYVWSVLAPNLEGQTFYCYIHGFEARRWVRSLHNYRSGDVLERELAASIRRQQFWRNVIAHPNAPKKFIFVSNWWYEAAQEDLELRIPRQKVEIIHNLVDTGLFKYVEKSPEQRFKILWVRTANNFNYGSDIAVRVLKELRETPYWTQLEVKVIGDGRYFGEFEATFAEDENVEIERGFINQEEIARLHRQYGLFLVPTRLDTQGVSRDEAMASGLVPITNAVAAVPEFVGNDEAILAGPEDVQGMVSGIVGLLKHPDRFLQMSRAAASRVAGQSGPTQTVAKEIKLMGLAPETANQ
ncbi:glycosyltransferase family 4 protein [Gulosibacter molinativorax]|uniref:glycosyltransferase family 4 protein n=1 Tax=Gulosibacter molinativorax TaxID=256821 RepID=UPI0022403FE8|nr:glycosyltransferase family 4 protein [Gulosibacter molinativorax]